MSYSSLVSQYIPAAAGNYATGRNGYRICKITPHHMAGKLTAAACGNIFKNPSRQASSNYGIGYDGEIACYVDEENRAYTSSSRNNDCQAITIEVSNNMNSEPWGISDASWNSLVNLCVDICKRYNLKLYYDKTPNGSLTRHDMFAATNCPGQTLGGRFPELVQTVNAILDGGQPEPKPTPTPTPGFQPYTVKVTTNCLNIRQGAGTNYAITGQITDHGVYTIIEESTGTGASLWGKLKSGAGWIALDYTTKSGNIPTPSGYVLGKYVVNTPKGLNVRNRPVDGSIIKVYPNGTKFDTYEIKDNWARTPSGWVCLDFCNLIYKY